MRFLAIFFISVIWASLALAQSRQPAQITTIPGVPQPFEKLEKSGTWIPLDTSRAVSPVAFGAKCDGVTDDTVALQAWAAATTDRSFLVVPGVCIFKNTLTFTQNAFAVTIAGEGGHTGELRYAGSSTTLDPLIKMGFNSAPNGCAIKGWTINGLKVMSTTKMTAGDAVRISEACDMRINNLTVGGNLDNGNRNAFNALHLDSGNTVHIIGGIYQGSNVGVKVHGNTTYRFTEPSLYNVQIVKSRIGLHICGAVGGIIADASDLLVNGTHVRIDQSCAPVFNSQMMFGPHFMVDDTDSVAYPNEPNVGIYVADPGGPQTIITYRGWMASADKQCFVIENMGPPASGGTTVPEVVFSGAYIGNCHAPLGSMGSAIENNNLYYKVSVVSSSFFGNQGGRATIRNVSGAKPIKILGINPNNDAAFNIVGAWSGYYTAINGETLIRDDTSASTVVLNVAAPNNSSGSVIRMQGNGPTTPDKWLRARDGTFDIISSDYARGLLILDDTGTLTLGNMLKTRAYAIGSLPACPGSASVNIGMRTQVSDGQTSPPYRGAVAATGTTYAAVFCSTGGWIYN